MYDEIVVPASICVWYMLQSYKCTPESEVTLF